MRFVLVALLLTAPLLSACVDPRVNAGISIGQNGTTVTPSISGGIPGGGRLTYTP